MFGLDLMMTGLLILAADDLVCPGKNAPRVSVRPENSAVKYDNTKSREKLENFNIDTVSPYELHTETHVGGLMSGEIVIESRIGFARDTFVNRRQVCISIQHVEVALKLDPVVYIAREFPKGTCKYDAILEHEHKHVTMDKLIINKYADRIGKAVSVVLEKYGSSFGPFPEDEQDINQKKLKDYIDKIVTAESELMNQERKARQQEIDSLDEYERVNLLCN